MNPAPALGAFLKHWRSQWAGLTQAQLAMAVGAASGRRRVTERVVRRWEEGQPPADTEELEGLLAVMRRHGLNEPEIGHVRRAIFAACLDRHYPGLFASEEFAHRPDVDELAQQSHVRWPAPPSSCDPVELVGQLRSLEAAVGRDLAPARPGSRNRRQQVALVFVRDTIRWYFEATARPELAARNAGANVALLRDCFGAGGVGYPLTLMLQRRAWAYNTGAARQSPASIDELLALSQQATAAGDHVAAASAFICAFSLTRHLGAPQRRRTLWPEVDRHLDALARGPLLLVFPAAVTDGRWSEAKALLAELDFLRDGNDWERLHWHYSMWQLAFYQGEPGEAETHVSAYRELAEKCGNRLMAETGQCSLRACEEAGKQRSYDAARLDYAAQREAKRITRAAQGGAINPAR